METDKEGQRARWDMLHSLASTLFHWQSDAFALLSSNCWSTSMNLTPSRTWMNRQRFFSKYNASGLSRFGQETPVLCTTERQLAIPFVQSLWPTIGWISFLFLRKLMRKYVVEGMSRTEWTPTGNAKRLSACPRQILTHVRASLCFDQNLPSCKVPQGFFTCGGSATAPQLSEQD